MASEKFHEEFSKPTIFVTQENINRIEKIDVLRWEEVMRANKNTTVYVIELWISGQLLSTKRSFSEFTILHKELTKLHPNIKFDDLPAKEFGILKKKGDPATNNIRMKFFDGFMKFCIANTVDASILSNFLQAPEILRVYGKDKALSPEEVAIQQNSNDAETRVFKDPRKKTGLIQDYAGEESKAESGERRESSTFFKVDATSEKRGDTTFYTFDIRDDQGTGYVVTKRYNDFKAFHDKLKKNTGKILDKTPLPDRGNLGMFVSGDDPKLIEYRKFGLKGYLQQLMNNPSLKGNKLLEEFLSTP